MKSSSANVGAMILADLCKEIEPAAADGRLDLAGMLLEKLLDEHKQVLRALDEQDIAA